MDVLRQADDYREDWKRELSHTFFARKGLIIGMFCFVFLVSALIAFLWTPVYVASASIMIGDQPAAESDSTIGLEEIHYSRMAPELEMLHSGEILQQTARYLLGLDGLSLPENHTELTPVEAERMDAIRRHLAIAPRPGSGIIRLSYHDRSPEEAERTLQALLDAYAGFRHRLQAERHGFFASSRDAEAMREDLRTLLAAWDENPGTDSAGVRDRLADLLASLDKVKTNPDAEGGGWLAPMHVVAGPEHTAELVFPRKTTTLLFGFILALIIGFSAGFLAEYSDHTVRRPEDVYRNLGLPVVCSIQKE